MKTIAKAGIIGAVEGLVGTVVGLGIIAGVGMMINKASDSKEDKKGSEYKSDCINRMKEMYNEKKAENIVKTTLDSFDK